jgi:hypothetical protein
VHEGIVIAARTWLSIRVELVSGHGADLWPRPGRVFAAARSHYFAQFAAAIDLAFARRDLAHLHLFTLSDGTRVSPLDWWDDEAPDGTVDGHATMLSRLQAGEQFAYVFDMGDDWTTCARWRTSASTPSTNSARNPAARFPTGAGATSRTNTHAAGTATTGSRRCRSGRPAGSATCLRSCGGGASAPEDDLTLRARSGRQWGIEVATVGS